MLQVSENSTGASSPRGKVALQIQELRDKSINTDFIETWFNEISFRG